MKTIYYNADGFIYGVKPYFTKVEKVFSLEITKQKFETLCCTPQFHCWKVVNGEVKLVINELAEYTDYMTKQNAQKELNELTSWFNDVYDTQVKQYERCKRLGITYDNKYGSIGELDVQALQNAERINELKAILNG